MRLFRRRNPLDDTGAYTPYESWDRKMSRWLDEAGAATRRDTDWVDRMLRTEPTHDAFDEPTRPLTPVPAARVPRWLTRNR